MMLTAAAVLMREAVADVLRVSGLGTAYVARSAMSVQPELHLPALM